MLPVGARATHLRVVVRGAGEYPPVVLLARPLLEKIVAGDVTLVFRRWLRPSVRAGGTLKTALGVLAIEDVARTTESQIQEADVRAAGYPDRNALLADVRQREGDLYRVRVRFAGADPRIALRQNAELAQAELAEIEQRMQRLDATSRSGPWALAALRLIGARPAVLAARLAQQLGQPTAVFKRNIRKLKELGLTESLEVGYRLSPRGQRVLELLGSGTPG
jgi:hypothetical protein